MIEWLQNWYNEQCDGEWEHSNVIKIESIDNPGWSVKIDFNYTDILTSDIPWKLFEKSENSWVGYSIENNVFKGAGSSLTLSLQISLFKELVDNNRIDDTEIMIKL